MWVTPGRMTITWESMTHRGWWQMYLMPLNWMFCVFYQYCLFFFFYKLLKEKRKWSDSGYILKVLAMRLSKRLDMGCSERQRASRMTPGPGAQATTGMAMPFPEMGRYMSWTLSVHFSDPLGSLWLFLNSPPLVSSCWCSWWPAPMLLGSLCPCKEVPRSSPPQS